MLRYVTVVTRRLRMPHRRGCLTVAKSSDSTHAVLAITNESCLYRDKQGQRGWPPLSPAPPIPAEPPPLRSGPPSRTISLDEAEHFLHNHHASVASLRLLFTFAPECRSASLRNRCSPSPEYPIDIDDIEVNLLTGRMAEAWSDEPPYLTVEGRCFSSKYADRMRIQESR